ncbi:MAG: Ig-like domain-containing protein [Anaerostipes sp.]|jgi:uncharacterized protein YkwD
MEKNIKKKYQILLSNMLALALVFFNSVGNINSIRAYAAERTSNVNIEVKYGQTDARSMLSMVNDFRKSEDAWYWDSTSTNKVICKNLQDLTYDYELEKDAMLRAAEIAVSFSHTRPNGNTWNTVNPARLDGENIAAGNKTTKNTFIQWQETDESYDGQGHRRSMLSSEFKAIGIGHVTYNGYDYWVQEFSRSVGSQESSSANEIKQKVPVELLNSQMTNVELKTERDEYNITCKDEVGLPTATLGFNFTNHWPSGKVIGEVPVTYSIKDNQYATINNDKIKALKAGTTKIIINGFDISKTVGLSVQHQWDDEYTIDTQPTCTESGSKSIYCALCQEKEEGSSVSINPTGHQHTEIKNKKDASCTESGYTGDLYCNDCNQVIKAGEVIKATEHDYEGKVTKEATCKEDGIETFTCKKCKNTYTKTIPKTEGHTWNDGEVTKKPTCKETGIKTFTCSVCGKTKTDMIPKSDKHNFDEGVISKQPTCEASGEKIFTCKDCNASEIEVLKALGHNYGLWTTVSKATVFAPEMRIHTCERCGETETVVFGSKINPTMRLDKTNINLSYARTNDMIKVSGLANGDSVKSMVSSNPKIATVSSSGKVYAKGNGTTKITVTLASGFTKTVTVKVTSSIRNVPTKKIIKRKKSYTLKPKTFLLGKVNYRTSNKKIATVSSKGKITAKKKGKVKITVYSGNKKVICAITVK